MYIFSRSRTIDLGRNSEALSGATESARRVEELTDLTVSTWHQQFALTGPAIVWSARAEHMEAFYRAFELINASESYQDFTAELDECFTGPAVDNMVQIVAGTPPAAPTPLVSIVQATATNGHLRAAIHWGSDLAERVSSSLDAPTIFGRGLYGAYGTLMWGSYFEDINAVEGTQAKLATDEMLQAVIDEGGHNVQPGAMATLMRKLD